MSHLQSSGLDPSQVQTSTISITTQRVPTAASKSLDIPIDNSHASVGIFSSVHTSSRNWRNTCRMPFTVSRYATARQTSKSDVSPGLPIVIKPEKVNWGHWCTTCEASSTTCTASLNPPLAATQSVVSVNCARSLTQCCIVRVIYYIAPLRCCTARTH